MVAVTLRPQRRGASAQENNAKGVEGREEEEKQKRCRLEGQAATPD